MQGEAFPLKPTDIRYVTVLTNALNSASRLLYYGHGMVRRRVAPSGQRITAAELDRGLAHEPSRWTQSHSPDSGCWSASRMLTHPHPLRSDTCIAVVALKNRY